MFIFLDIFLMLHWMIVVKKIFMLIVTCVVVIIYIVEKYILIKNNHENLWFSNVHKLVMIPTRKTYSYCYLWYCHGHLYL